MTTQLSIISVYIYCVSSLPVVLLEFLPKSHDKSFLVFFFKKGGTYDISSSRDATYSTHITHSLSFYCVYVRHIHSTTYVRLPLERMQATGLLPCPT
jgi:hypothetical protein